MKWIAMVGLTIALLTISKLVPANESAKCAAKCEPKCRAILRHQRVDYSGCESQCHYGCDQQTNDARELSMCVNNCDYECSNAGSAQLNSILSSCIAGCQASCESK
jgi:hypothetical protein